MIETRSEDALPPVAEDMTTDPESDRIPVSVGEVRLYFNDRLMAYNQVEFQIAFERGDTLDPQFLTADPPVENFEYDREGDVPVELDMPEEDIAVREQSVDAETFEATTHDGEWVEVARERVWKPENGGEYDFEIRLEVTPYGDTESEQESDGESDT